jgi:phosphatidylinositol alpha-1,6-mannosyltransferase
LCGGHGSRCTSSHHTQKLNDPFVFLMQILLLATEFLSVGGIQRQTRLLVAALDELLTNVNGKLRVLALNDPLSANLPPELAGLCSTEITCYASNRVAYVLQSLAEIRQADLVIYGLLGLTLMSFAHRVLAPSTRCLLMMHGIEVWRRRSWLHALAVRNMQGYVSVSQYTLDRFCAAYSLDGHAPSFVLLNAVTPRLFQDIAQSTPDQTGELRLLTVSRLAVSEEYKGIDSVIRAMPALLREFPNLRYAIIGDGGDRRRLESIARELCVEQHIEFLGHVSDEALKSAYQNCTVFVLPSAGEGFGLVFIEAMAFGKPVVAARAGAAPEVVWDGQTGLLVEHGDVAQLTQAIATLLQNPDLSRQMGQAGLEVVKTRFSFNAFKANLSDILAACGLPVSPSCRVNQASRD